ncbi:MAG: polyprenyl synthetase family protein [Spirochaetota bacterium]
MEFKYLYEPIEKDLKLVENELVSQIKTIITTRNKTNDGYLYDVISHLFRIPGKRLRPSLVLLSAKSAGEIPATRNNTLVQFAAAVELVHSASLVHDDIIDNSEYRRDSLSLNKKYGSKIAVLAGDILYSQFFFLLTNLPLKDKEQKIKLFRIFCDITQNMCLGEILQQRIIKKEVKPTFSDYMEILTKKTALLMSASCRCGALLNDAAEDIVVSLADFGLHFGLAYQLVDDYVDMDSLIDGTVDLVTEAENEITHAKNCLVQLKKSPSKEKLLGLCDYVLSIAYQNRKI